MYIYGDIRITSGISSDSLVQQENTSGYIGSGIDTQRNNNGTFNTNRSYNTNSASSSSGYQFASNRGVNAIHANASAYSQPSPYFDSNNNNNNNNNSSTNNSGSYPAGRVGGALSSGEYEQGMDSSYFALFVGLLIIIVTIICRCY